MTGYTYKNPNGHTYRLKTALTDSQGNILEQTTYNSETVVLCNDDGSVRRGTAGPPVPNDPYSPTWTPAPWEKL